MSQMFKRLTRKKKDEPDPAKVGLHAHGIIFRVCVCVTFIMSGSAGDSSST